jgi:hypothetical protein
MKSKPGSAGLLHLQRSNIFIEEVFEFFIGQHFIDEPEDGLFVLVIELLDEPHLLYGGFIFDDYFFGHPAIIVNDLVSGEVKELCHFLKFIYG